MSNFCFEYTIIESYREDITGEMIDVILRSDGEARKGFVKEWKGNLTFCLITESGKVIKSSWSTTAKNTWLIAYRELYITRLENEIAQKRERLSQLANKILTPEEAIASIF